MKKEEKESIEATLIMLLAMLGGLFSGADEITFKAISGLIIFGGFLSLISDRIDTNLFLTLSIAIIGAVIGTQIGVWHLYVAAMIFIGIMVSIVSSMSEEDKKLPPRTILWIMNLTLISIGLLSLSLHI